jgi:preprotein translocase subunit YajC
VGWFLPRSPTVSPAMAMIILLVLFVLMWVVLIVPRQRELRRHQALMRELEVGDEVMMGSGIYGTITDLEDDIVHLSLAPGVEISAPRRAVAANVPVPPATTPELADAEDEVEAEAIDAAMAEEPPAEDRS